jgi:hypothetical protein
LLQLHLGLEAKACFVAIRKRLVLGILLEVKRPGAGIMRVVCSSKGWHPILVVALTRKEKNNSEKKMVQKSEVVLGLRKHILWLVIGVTVDFTWPPVGS